MRADASNIPLVSRNPPPACLWKENPNRFVTLFQMLQFNAHSFVTLVNDLADLESRARVEDPGLADHHRPKDFVEILLRIQVESKMLRLMSAYKQAVHALRVIEGKSAESGAVSYALLETLFGDLRRWVVNDLEETVFYKVDSELVSDFYRKEPPDAYDPLAELDAIDKRTDSIVRRYVLRSSAELFGIDVASKFASLSNEIEESAQCLVLDRSTASVFHLMRVMEVGLRSLGKSLNESSLDPKKNPSWEAILRKCDDQLQKPNAQRSTEWQTDPTFFATATANLRAVKDAWRNPTMHIERDYDPEEARDVWNSVRAFMRHLASKLSE